MQAYLNNPALKAKLIEQITAHRDADHLSRGTYRYTRDGHFIGCAVGCSIESLNRLTGSKHIHSDHSCYEPGFGVPEILARLQDNLFESLPNGEHLDWPLAFWQAVPVGADLTMVWPRFAHWLLVDPHDGVIRYAKPDSVRKSVERVAALYARWIAGEKPDDAEWISAAVDAVQPASDAASAAFYAAHASSAASAASASSSDAADAAAASSDAAADADARRKQAAKLLELIAAAPQSAPQSKQEGAM